MSRRIVLGTALVVLGLGILPEADARRFRFEEEEIVGEVQKPDVTVVISRENLNKAYELELEESFIQKIIDSVESDPF